MRVSQALYSVFIFRLFSDKPPSENQDEGSIGDSGEHQSDEDESRFRSQVKNKKKKILVVSSQHVRDMLFSVSHRK